MPPQPGATQTPAATIEDASGGAPATTLGQTPATIEIDRFLLPAIALGATFAPLNSTMVAVALPEIQRSFGVSITATSWLVTIYLVAMAAGLPVGGWLGDIFGRRRVYLAGLVLFGIASAGCAFAPDFAWLIVFRTMQGLAGTLSLPNGAAMVREVVPQERRGSAFGQIGMVAGIAAASGPPLGGVLVHAFGWSAIFWANVPVIAAALLVGWRSIPRRRPRHIARTRFDFVGTLLLTSSLATTVLVPFSLRSGSPVLAVGCGILGISIGCAFVIWERRTSAPVVDVGLFASSHFASACAAVGLGNIVLYTMLLALPLYVEGVLHRSVQASGFTLAALSALSAIFGPVGGRWADRAGHWLPAVAGGVSVLVGVLTIIVGIGAKRIAVIVVGLAIVGVGLGVASASLQTAAVEAVPLEKAGSAAGIYWTSRYLGSVVGSSLLAALFAQRHGDVPNDLFIVLFVVVAIAAAAGIFANAGIAARRVTGPGVESVR